METSPAFENCSQNGEFIMIIYCHQEEPPDDWTGHVFLGTSWTVFESIPSIIRSDDDCVVRVLARDLTSGRGSRVVGWFPVVPWWLPVDGVLFISFRRVPVFEGVESSRLSSSISIFNPDEIVVVVILFVNWIWKFESPRRRFVQGFEFWKFLNLNF